jgi:ABC-type branched-subunit amino acid transport system ATPase component
VRSGKVSLFRDGQEVVDVTGRRPNAITALGLNMVPQLANVFPEMSVLENLQIGALPARDRYDLQLSPRCSTPCRCCARCSASAPPRSPAASARCSRSAAR